MAKSNNSIRIISGSLRGRKIPVLDLQGLRPTGDRVRETLFNWLQFEIVNKSVLDLFAGSGALGFEAASRGAKLVTLVEKNPKAAKQLNDICIDFNLKNIQVKNISAQSYIQDHAKKHDIIFLDPPFQLQNELLSNVSEHIDNLVETEGYVYCEMEKNQQSMNFPANFELYRHKIMGQVKIELWKKHTEQASPA